VHIESKARKVLYRKQAGKTFSPRDQHPFHHRALIPSDANL
jgi:hypothetical protein